MITRLNDFKKLNIMSNQEIMPANFFQGENTYGYRVHIGVNKEGICFFRSYVFNGYGMAWSKWEKDEHISNKKIRYEEQSDGTIIPYMKFGWNDLKGFFYKGLRLPKL